MAQRLNATDPDFEAQFTALVEGRRGSEQSVADVVSTIIADVRSVGDAALLSCTRKFDRTVVDSVAELCISAERVEAAVGECDAALIAALRNAAARIDAYHRRQMPEGFDYVDESGIRLGARWTALDAVGLYVPGGTAAYPSSVLMNAVPAKVAGVKRMAMVVPAPEGMLNPLVLAAAHVAGIEEIYTIGGAQAVAALAYGTESIAPVDKIVGPGNAYVAEAKRQVFGRVGIDMIAGPSEILVVADAENDPDWIAADLLSQAEHDTEAQSILICADETFADAVEAAVEKFLGELPRADIARESWKKYGAVICVDHLDDAPALVDRLAAEHVELAVEDPDALMERISHAGAIFLGRHSPEALGDYLAGPSHVLPTSRSARFSSGLGVYDFLKRSSIIGSGAEGLAALTADGEALAAAEGLDAHRLSLAVRSGSNLKGSSGGGE